MIQIDQDECIDWFVVFNQINRRCNYSLTKIAKDNKIPISTLSGWKNNDSRPSLEDGVRVINYWLTETKQTIDKIPIKNKFA